MRADWSDSLNIIKSKKSVVIRLLDLTLCARSVQRAHAHSMQIRASPHIICTYVRAGGPSVRG